MIREKDLPTLVSYMETLGLTDPVARDTINFNPEREGVVFQKVQRREKGEFVMFQSVVSLNKDLGMFELHGFRALIFNTPEVRHGIYRLVDTRDLEKRMAAMDWDNAEKTNVFFKTDGEVAKIFKDLQKLIELNSKASLDAAEHLMLRYWKGTAMEIFIARNPKLSLYEDQMYFELNGDHKDINAAQAYRLLHGRGIFLLEKLDGNAEGYWLVIQGDKLERLPDYDLTGLLREMPFKDPLYELGTIERALKLSNGEIIPETLVIGSKEVEVFIAADPVNTSIVVFDLNANQLDLEVILGKKEGSILIKDDQKTNQKDRKPGKRPGL